MVEFEDELEEEFDEEFDDEFEEDWEEFEPEAEEFFTGPLYIPTESSVNFEHYTLIGAIVVMIIASYLLYTKVLVGVYDSGFGGETYDEKVANFDYQQAKEKVEILGFGKYNPEPENEKEPFDYAVLDAGTNQGISAGMIFYFNPAKGTGIRNGYWDVDPLNPKVEAKLQIKPEELTMLVVREVGDDYAWAEFAKYISEDDKKQFKSTTGEEMKNVLHDYVVQKKKLSIIAYTNTKSPVTIDTPLPYKPKPHKPLQYNIWEEAYDLSGDKIYKAINLETIDKNFNIITTAVEEDYTDPNTDWNVLKRIKLTIDEIKSLLEIKEEQAAINESSVMVNMNRETLPNALILFSKAQFAYIAPPVDQTLFRLVSNKLDELKD
ncbi:MAG: hypothetical protein K8S87_09615 [Planctomycetes bacterium]|nr:hypothetical protein [Planctomycetota bacterium]